MYNLFIESFKYLLNDFHFQVSLSCLQKIVIDHLFQELLLWIFTFNLLLLEF